MGVEATQAANAADGNLGEVSRFSTLGYSQLPELSSSSKPAEFSTSGGKSVEKQQHMTSSRNVSEASSPANLPPAISVAHSDADFAGKGAEHVAERSTPPRWILDFQSDATPRTNIPSTSAAEITIPSNHYEIGGGLPVTGTWPTDNPSHDSVTAEVAASPCFARDSTRAGCWRGSWMPATSEAL